MHAGLDRSSDERCEALNLSKPSQIKRTKYAEQLGV